MKLLLSPTVIESGISLMDTAGRQSLRAHGTSSGVASSSLAAGVGVAGIDVASGVCACAVLSDGANKANMTTTAASDKSAILRVGIAMSTLLQ